MRIIPKNHCSIGALLAITGCLCNLLLLIIFIIGRRRQNISLYYKLLAFLDLLICFTYIWMFFLPKFSEILRIETLYILVWQANIFVYTVARMTQCAIPYIIIAQTAERFMHLKRGKTFAHKLVSSFQIASSN